MQNLLNKIKEDKRIKKGYLVGFIVLSISCFITLYANRNLKMQNDGVIHTNQVISSLEALISEIKDAETGIRGYLVNRDSSFLQPYIGSKKNADSISRNIKNLIKGDRAQEQTLSEINDIMNEKYATLDETIRYFLSNFKTTDETVYIQQVKGKRKMDELRKKILSMQSYETEGLKERNGKLVQNYTALNIIIISTLLIAVLILVVGFVAHTRENKARRDAERKIKNYQEELKTKIQDLSAANKELIKMKGLEKFAATGRIARTIAHEVRNPLTNINLAAEQLKSGLKGNYSETDFLFEMINRNSSRINQLISDLLNSTKFSELHIEKISVNDLLDEALMQAKDRIALTNTEVIKKYSTDICEISVDKERLKMALLNLIINALEAIDNKPDGQLTLETKGEDGKCKIVISDNGTGMDGEAIGRLFEPYFTNKPKGNGLGLTNTQNIILNHKGDIAVESKKGLGTTFIITLDFAA